MSKEIDPYWLQQAPHRAIFQVRPLRKAISSQLALFLLRTSQSKDSDFRGKKVRVMKR